MNGTDKRLGILLIMLLALTGMGSGRGPAGTPDDYFLSPGYATDSAAAATALATGQKTDKGNIAWAAGDPAGGALATVAEQLRAEYGLALGAVTTVPFNHATPASFLAHNSNRGNTEAIAQEMILETVPEVVVAGGYASGYFPLSSPTYAALAGGQTAYTHVVTRTAGADGGAALHAAAAAVSLAQGERLFGLFGTPGGNFAYHQVADDPGHPAVSQGAVEDPLLAEAVTSTLSVLAQDPEGFFAVIEQGDIDWANHRNNFATMIGGIWDLDEAVRAAEAFVDAPGGPEWADTLLVVTADHGNSYLRLPEPLGAGDLPRQVDDGAWSYPDGEVTYATTGHTNELATVAARGRGAGLFRTAAGAWYPETRIVDNTQVYDLLQRAVKEAGARHLLLFVGDGMQLAHEVAGSRYLYGADLALAWHDWELAAEGWRGFATTWDVTTYDNYAGDAGAATYDPATFDPLLGYDGTRGGWVPYPLVAGAGPQVTIARTAGELRWTPVLVACSYQVYRSDAPYAGYERVATYTGEATHEIGAALADGNGPSFYLVDTAACGLRATAPSGRVGIFHQPLQ